MHPVINDVETGRTPEYPDLQPQRFSADRAAVLAAIQRVAGRQERWRVRSFDAEAGELKAVATTKWMRFRDDVTLWIEEDDGVVVRMRSRSRLGKGDFGVNAARIRRLQRQLAAELEGSA